MTPRPAEHALPEIEIACSLSSIRNLDETSARLEGVVNLLLKASRLIERGGPGDRAKVLSLAERAERFIPDPGDAAGLDREGIAAMVTAVRAARTSALQLPE